MKRAVCFIFSALIALSLSSCNKEEEGFITGEVHTINAEPNDIERFFGEIREYAATFDPDFKLIRVFIDYSGSGEIEAMYIDFDAKTTKSKTEKWLDLRYDPVLGGINCTSYSIGPIKGLWVNENEKLDTSRWKTDFTSAYKKAREEFMKQSDKPIESVSVACEQTEWEYKFYINEGLPWPDGADLATDRVGLISMQRKMVSVSVNVCE